MNLNELRDKAYKIACEHGFHDTELSNKHFLCLIISELMEAVEADRRGKRANVDWFEKKISTSRICQGLDLDIPKERGYEVAYNETIKGSIEEELADAVIRLLDLAGLRGINLELANGDIDDCIEELKDYSEDSVPVLDNDNKLLGVITSQSIVELVDDEMGEDYARLAGLMAEEDLKEPLLDSMKKRLPWLIILLGLGMLVSSVVGIFEQVVTTLPIIMTFQSLILDMAGNVGTQSLAVTIRVLMDESLTGKQKLQLVFKEMRIGFCNGLLLGVLSFAVIGLFIFLFKGKTMMFAFSVSACIGIALLLAMLISSAVGTCIPLFFKKIHIDPAVASGPLITTVNDLVAVVTFYGLSWLFLIEMLHLAG